MNLVDAGIILLAVGSIMRGWQLGFTRQLFSTTGFFGGLLLGALLEPRIMVLAHTQLARLIVTVGVLLGPALLLSFVGEMIGVWLKRRLQLARGLDHADSSLGAGLAGASLLALIWLSAAVVVTLPYLPVQSAVRGSRIVSALDSNLPPAPAIIAGIGHIVAPNGFPDVFIGAEPTPSQAPLPAPGDLAAAVAKDSPSVVKIEGQGCGGIVEGSGFVVANGLVVTNAHVVAGITSPYIIDGSGTHPAAPIWFDPNLDVAVLSASGLAGAPLHFNTGTISDGTPGGVLGYPGGGPFSATGAAIMEEITAIGRNIYNQNNTERDVYSIKANVVPGNSGGPLIDTNGNVMGVVFATSTSYNDVGYALTARPVLNEIHQAEAGGRQTVSTGGCAEG